MRIFLSSFLVLAVFLTACSATEGDATPSPAPAEEAVVVPTAAEEMVVEPTPGAVEVVEPTATPAEVETARSMLCPCRVRNRLEIAPPPTPISDARRPMTMP